MGEGDAIKHKAELAERARILAVIRRRKSEAELAGEERVSEGDVNQHAAGVLASILEELGEDPGVKP